jgi:hypothetical protein
MPILTSSTATLAQTYPRTNKALKFYCDDCFYQNDMHDIITDLYHKYSPYPILVQPYHKAPNHFGRYRRWGKWGSTYGISNNQKPSVLIMGTSNNYSASYMA